MSFITKVDAGTDSLLDNIVNISADNNDTFTGDGPGFIMQKIRKYQDEKINSSTSKNQLHLKIMVQN